MSTEQYEKEIARGVAAIDAGNTMLASVHFEEAQRLRDTPEARSYRAFCMASEQNRFQEAANLCLSAMQQDPRSSVHYLNLGRIYLLAGQKSKAIRTFRRGLKVEQNRKIITELKQLGLRAEPLFSSLGREHPLNKFLGKLFRTLGLR